MFPHLMTFNDLAIGDRFCFVRASSKEMQVVYTKTGPRDFERVTDDTTMTGRVGIGDNPVMPMILSTTIDCKGATS